MRARRGRARELCHVPRNTTGAKGRRGGEEAAVRRGPRGGVAGGSADTGTGTGGVLVGESYDRGPAPPPDGLLPRKLLPEPRIPRHQRVVALEPLPERPAAPQAALVGEVVHVADGDGQAVVDGRLALAEIWTRRLYQRSV